MAVAAPLLIAATAVAAVGAAQQAKAQSDAAKFNEQVANQEAVAEVQAARVEAARAERESRLEIGTARANRGGSGVTLEGSPIEVLSAAAVEQELNRLTILHGGKARAAALRGEANLSGAEASNAQRAGFFNVGSTILQGGAGLQQTGFFNNRNPQLAKRGEPGFRALSGRV